jgi:hypothetical protein
MNLAFAVVFLWVGCAMLYLGSHGLEAATPWGALQTLMTKARGDA